MEYWSPLFSKIVESSLWGEPDVVVKVFLTMLAKKDAQHRVMKNAYEIGQWARKSEREVIEAIKILCSPDTRRIEPQPFDGRRLTKIEGGWLVLNGQYYHDMMRTQKRKEYKRVKQAEYRKTAAQMRARDEIGRTVEVNGAESD